MKKLIAFFKARPDFLWTCMLAPLAVTMAFILFGVYVAIWIAYMWCLVGVNELIIHSLKEDIEKKQRQIDELYDALDARDDE